MLENKICCVVRVFVSFVSANNFLVSEKYKTIACVNMKAASTTWKLVFMNNSFAKPLPANISFITYLSTYHNFQERKKTRLELYSPSEIRHRLKHYYKIISVRHPFERLLSVYKDKLNWDR